MDLPNISIQSPGGFRQNSHHPKAPGSVLRSFLARLCQLLQDVCRLLRELVSSLTGIETKRQTGKAQLAGQVARENRNDSVRDEANDSEQNGTEVDGPTTQQEEERGSGENDRDQKSTETRKAGARTKQEEEEGEEEEEDKEEDEERKGENDRDQKSTETHKADPRTGQEKEEEEEEEEERKGENDPDHKSTETHKAGPETEQEKDSVRKHGSGLNCTESSKDGEARKERETERVEDGDSAQKTTKSRKADNSRRDQVKEGTRENEAAQNSTEPSKTVDARTEQEKEKVGESNIEEKPTKPCRVDDAGSEQDNERVGENSMEEKLTEPCKTGDATTHQQKERVRENDNDQNNVDAEKAEESRIQQEKGRGGEQQVHDSEQRNVSEQQVHNNEQHNVSEQHHDNEQHNIEQHNIKQHNDSEHQKEQPDFQGKHDLKNGSRDVAASAQSFVIDPLHTDWTKKRGQEKEKDHEEDHDDFHGGVHIEKNPDQAKTDVDNLDKNKTEGGEKQNLEPGNSDELPAFQGECEVKNTARDNGSLHTSDGTPRRTDAQKDCCDHDNKDQQLNGRPELHTTTHAMGSPHSSAIQHYAGNRNEREKEEQVEKVNTEKDHSVGQQDDTAVRAKDEEVTNRDDNEKAKTQIKKNPTKEIQAKSREEQVKSKVEQAKQKAEKAKLSAEQALAKAQQAKTKAEQAMSKEEQAKHRAEQAVTKAKQAQMKVEQAQTKAELAKTKEEQAKNKAEQVKSKAEHASVKVEEAKTKIDHAKTKEEQAKSKAEQASVRAEQAKCKAEQASVKAELARKKEEEAKTKAEQAKIKAEQALAKEEQVKAEQASVKTDQVQIKAEKTKTGEQHAKRKSGKISIKTELAKPTEEHAGDKVGQTKARARKTNVRADQIQEQKTKIAGEQAKNKEELAKNKEEEPAKSKKEGGKNKKDQTRIKSEQATNQAKPVNANGVSKHSEMLPQTENGAASSTPPDRQKARKVKKRSQGKAEHITSVTLQQPGSQTDTANGTESATRAPQQGGHAETQPQDRLDIQHVKRSREQQDDLEKQAQPPQAKRYREDIDLTVGQNDTSKDSKTRESMQRSGEEKTLMVNGNTKEQHDSPEREERPKIRQDPVPGNELQIDKNTTETGLFEGDNCQTMRLLDNGKGTEEGEGRHPDATILKEKNMTDDNDSTFLKPTEAQEVVVNIVAEVVDQILDSDRFTAQDMEKTQGVARKCQMRQEFAASMSNDQDTREESNSRVEEEGKQLSEYRPGTEEIVELPQGDSEPESVPETSTNIAETPRDIVQATPGEDDSAEEDSGQPRPQNQSSEEIVELPEGYEEPEGMLETLDYIVETPKLDAEKLQDYLATPGENTEFLAEDPDQLSPKYKAVDEIVELPEGYTESEGVLETSDCIVEQPGEVDDEDDEDGDSDDDDSEDDEDDDDDDEDNDDDDDDEDDDDDDDDVDDDE